MSNVHRFPDRGRAPGSGPVSISPRFIPFLAAFLASGAALFTGLASGGVPVFVFVMSGWIVSLCLHEFGHAYVAYRGGDLGVKDRGYLSLDPFGYSHVVFSIVLPTLFLAMGGIALPGGAIYVDRSKLRSRRREAGVALAGPAMTFAFMLCCAAPFFLGFDGSGRANVASHVVLGELNFWAGLGMLAYLQAMALVFNLLPLPGFDGFNALAAFLPPNVEKKAQEFAQPVMLLLILAILVFPRILWPIQELAFFLVNSFRVNIYAIIEGLRLFRFWS